MRLLKTNVPTCLSEDSADKGVDNNDGSGKASESDSTLKTSSNSEKNTDSDNNDEPQTTLVVPLPSQKDIDKQMKWG